jgi:hypothetical protein
MRPLTSRERNDPITWLLVVLLSIVAGGSAYLWAGATTSVQQCMINGSGGDASTIGLGILWLAVPVLVAVRALRTAPTRAHAAIPIVVSLLIAPVCIFVGASLWWSGHNCMT